MQRWLKDVRGEKDNPTRIDREAGCMEGYPN
jgi:hypothetical protein